ncbi:MAG: hypothetical protein KGY42_03390 [Desulfobacterales bacterium]|nr:hypothetical protein [Desulfobacterales bacterium]MBS3756399.1 hypothetical protein [Desulfobacterales bacterium]
MGKKSLTQSTDKKKNSSAGKKSAGTSKKDTGANKKDTRKKTAAASAKSKTTKKTTAKNTSAPKKTAKKPSLKTLRKRKFDTWQPEHPFVPEKSADPERNYTAPAVTDDYGAEAGKKIQALLLKQIDLSTPEPEPAPARPEADTGDAQKDKEKALAAKTEEATAVQAAPPGETGPETGKPAPKTQAADKTDATRKPAPEKEQDKPSGDGKPPEPPGPTGPSGPAGGDGGGGKRELPVSRAMMVLIGAIALIFVLLIGASIQNMDSYYLKQTNTALEIWRGDFSPAGKTKIAVLRGAEAPAEIRDSYSREQALTHAYTYYMEKADSLSEATDLPDFRAIRDYLEKAEQFAVTQKQRSRIKKRLHRIEYLKLLYQAEVAAEKHTQSGLETALDYLEQASGLEIDAEEQQIVKQRINRTRQALEKLEKQEEDAASAEKSEPRDAHTTESKRTSADEDTEEKPESDKPAESTE